MSERQHDGAAGGPELRAVARRGCRRRGPGAGRPAPKIESLVAQAERLGRGQPLGDERGRLVELHERRTRGEREVADAGLARRVHAQDGDRLAVALVRPGSDPRYVRRSIAGARERHAGHACDRGERRADSPVSANAATRRSARPDERGDGPVDRGVEARADRERRDEHGHAERDPERVSRLRVGRATTLRQAYGTRPRTVAGA